MQTNDVCLLRLSDRSEPAQTQQTTQERDRQALPIAISSADCHHLLHYPDGDRCKLPTTGTPAPQQSPGQSRTPLRAGASRGTHDGHSPQYMSRRHRGYNGPPPISVRVTEPLCVGTGWLPLIFWWEQLHFESAGALVQSLSWAATAPRPKSKSQLLLMGPVPIPEVVAIWGQSCRFQWGFSNR